MYSLNTSPHNQYYTPQNQYRPQNNIDHRTNTRHRTHAHHRTNTCHRTNTHHNATIHTTDEIYRLNYMKKKYEYQAHLAAIMVSEGFLIIHNQEKVMLYLFMEYIFRIMNAYLVWYILRNMDISKSSNKMIILWKVSLCANMNT